MSDLLVIAAFVSFLAFFVAGRYRKYAALAGWSCIIINLWSEVPSFLQETNFLYPSLAILSLPFLLITAERLFHDDPAVLQLSRAAAIALVIWAPFALVPLLRDGLVAFVVMLDLALVTALGHHPVVYAWDMFGENGFNNQIVPGCTGILAVAMMLGVVFSERDLAPRQALTGFLLIVPPIFILNLLRISVVFIAVSDRWFAAWPDPTGTGDANFFWAHNVIAEGLALLFLAGLVWALARTIPHLGTVARELAGVYSRGIRRLVVRERNSL